MDKNDPAHVFLQEFNKHIQQSERKSDRERRIVEEKNKLLVPLRKMLKQLMDAGVFVTHQSVHEHGVRVRTYAPQPLEVWEAQSSTHWQPGSSLFLNHPAQIEIAVSNPQHVDKEGKIVIRCATPHPLSHMIEIPFYDPIEASMALAKFLSQSTVRIERPDAIEDTRPPSLRFDPADEQEN